ncbi:hypothetical protein IT575_09695 [bacterium]|nr:hypothetical protein [bacterium]
MHSNGNTVTYAYDSMGRVATLTPAQGSNYRTEYLYNENGSVATVKIYVSGSNIDTTYSYDTTSGKLTQRNDPPRSGANIRITYGYDAAGRLETETVTRESGGATNLYKTTYAYSYIAAGSGGGHEILRTEQTYSGVPRPASACARRHLRWRRSRIPSVRGAQR